MQHQEAVSTYYIVDDVHLIEYNRLSLPQNSYSIHTTYTFYVFKQ